MADKQNAPIGTRFQQLVSDPERYFEEAWKSASEQVDRQIERDTRERGRRRAGFAPNQERSKR